MLPQLDTGTCFVAGTAISSPFFAEVPLFGAATAQAQNAHPTRARAPMQHGPMDDSDKIGDGLS